MSDRASSGGKARVDLIGQDVMGVPSSTRTTRMQCAQAKMLSRPTKIRRQLSKSRAPSFAPTGPSSPVMSTRFLPPLMVSDSSDTSASRPSSEATVGRVFYT